MDIAGCHCSIVMDTTVCMIVQSIAVYYNTAMGTAAYMTVQCHILHCSVGIYAAVCMILQYIAVE